MAAKFLVDSGPEASVLKNPMGPVSPGHKQVTPSVMIPDCWFPILGRDFFKN